MTIDLFAASFICRDAELGTVMPFGSWTPTVEGSDAVLASPPWSARLAGWLQPLLRRLRLDRAIRTA